MHGRPRRGIQCVSLDAQGYFAASADGSEFGTPRPCPARVQSRFRLGPGL